MLSTETMDEKLVTVKAEKAHAQRAIKWLKVQHKILAHYHDGALCTEPGIDAGKTATLLKEALKVTR